MITCNYKFQSDSWRFINKFAIIDRLTAFWLNEMFKKPPRN